MQGHIVAGTEPTNKGLNGWPKLIAAVLVTTIVTILITSFFDAGRESLVLRSDIDEIKRKINGIQARQDDISVKLSDMREKFLVYETHVLRIQQDMQKVEANSSRIGAIEQQVSKMVWLTGIVVENQRNIGETQKAMDRMMKDLNISVPP